MLMREIHSTVVPWDVDNSFIDFSQWSGRHRGATIGPAFYYYFGRLLEATILLVQILLMVLFSIGPEFEGFDDSDRTGH